MLVHVSYEKETCIFVRLDKVEKFSCSLHLLYVLYVLQKTFMYYFYNSTDLYYFLGVLYIFSSSPLPIMDLNYFPHFPEILDLHLVSRFVYFLECTYATKLHVLTDRCKSVGIDFGRQTK